MMELGKREPMTVEDIRELLALRNWRAIHLAVALDVTENTVYRWLMGVVKPRGPANILLRQLLTAARKEAAHEAAASGKRKQVAV